jgi:hypothetical protein
MPIDARGLPISTRSAEAAAAFDHLIAGSRDVARRMAEAAV